MQSPARLGPAYTLEDRHVASFVALRALTRGLVIATTVLPLLASSRPSAAQTAAAVTELEPPFIVGLEPSVRPPWAPRITVFQKNEEWYRRALTGISTPYPPSLWFLEDQGAWWTPFTHPGMTAPYDIRGWHGRNP